MRIYSVKPNRNIRLKLRHKHMAKYISRSSILLHRWVWDQVWNQTKIWMLRVCLCVCYQYYYRFVGSHFSECSIIQIEVCKELLAVGRESSHNKSWYEWWLYFKKFGRSNFFGTSDSFQSGVPIFQSMADPMTIFLLSHGLPLDQDTWLQLEFRLKKCQICHKKNHLIC